MYTYTTSDTRSTIIFASLLFLEQQTGETIILITMSSSINLAASLLLPQGQKPFTRSKQADSTMLADFTPDILSAEV